MQVKKETMQPVRSTPKIVGICNVTPDSFFDGGKLKNLDTTLAHIQTLIDEGADMIDIGAESTRPGAKTVSEEEQISRLAPVVERFASTFNVPLSIDTTRARVFDFCAKHGASILNDISALEDDPDMVATAAKHGVECVIMHRKGPSVSMQHNPSYEDVVSDVLSYLRGRVDVLKKAGIRSISVDPGIGFGKTLTQNLKLLHEIEAFKGLGCPVYIGASRKSFIHAIDGSDVSDRLGGSIASVLYAAQKGASYVRVHDVKATKQALTVFEAIQKGHYGKTN